MTGGRAPLVRWHSLSCVCAACLEADAAACCTLRGQRLAPVVGR